MGWNAGLAATVQPHLPKGPAVGGLVDGLAGGAHGGCSRLTSDLGDDIASEHGVLVGFVGQVGGQEVDESLNLVHHGVHIGHL